MTEKHWTLFCVVEGEASSNAFPVEIELSKTIGDLKDLIKTKKTNNFHDVDANELTLWSVSFKPVDKLKPIVVNGCESPKELHPMDDISDVFKETLPKKTIHIIVRRPPPVDPPVPTRPSTPELISVLQDHIEQELAIILNGVQHHYANRSLDPKELEMSQKKMLKSSFKRTLPYDQSAKDISLVMLGLQLGKQARTTTGETLRSIVEGDIGKSRGFRVVAMVAPSGSGKTATVIDLASKHFVIYCVCSTPRATVSADFNDLNFITLTKDVEKMYMSVVDEEQGDQLGIDFKVKARAGERVELEILARLLFLQLLLDNSPALDQLQFFREQTTTGGATIGVLVNKLREYDTLTIQAMLRFTQTKLHLLLVPRRLGLVIAVDEAQGAANDILANKLISPSALIDNKDNKDAIFDAKNQIQLKHCRSFLTPLSASLSSMQATLVMLGTALSLQNADHVYSALDKTSNFTRITDFPQFDASHVNKMISDLVDLSGCEIPPAKRRKLSGRARFSLGIINRLIADPTQISKQATLDNAIDCTIEHVKRQLRDEVRRILATDMTGENAQLLCRMVLAYRFHGSKISFASSETSHFVDRSLCRIQLQPDGVYLIMDEPLVAEAVEEVLKASNKDPTYIEHLDQL